MKTLALVVSVSFALLGFTALAGMDDTDTPQPMVDAYNSLADTMLGAKQTEWNLVHAILAGTYSHAEAVAGRAMAKLESGQDASEEIEALAALVGQIANEGDASIAAVRKRLIDGGHHHHSGGEAQGKYDEGFVIVTRDAKKVFLDTAKRIAKLGKGATADALAREWKTVGAEFKKLHAGTGMEH